MLFYHQNQLTRSVELRKVTHSEAATIHPSTFAGIIHINTFSHHRAEESLEIHIQLGEHCTMSIDTNVKRTERMGSARSCVASREKN